MEIIRELNKKFPMYSYTIYTIHIWSPCPNVHVLSISVLCVHHEVNILLTCTLIISFQLLLPESRLMTSHHVTFHVTVVTCLFIIQKKKKEIQKKRNIKLGNINIKKRKIFISKHTITLGFSCLASTSLKFLTEE